MSVAVRDAGAALARLSLDTSDRLGDRAPPSTRRSDAQLGIQELQVLRADVDMVVPPEAAALAEPLVDLFRGNLTSGDHLRLPLLTQHDAAGIKGAMARIIDADTTQVGGDREAIIKEERMRRVLRGLQGAVGTIQRQANTTRY